MLVLVVGPSGAGKDTLLDTVRATLHDDPRISFARREVTRPATPGGEDHLPIDADTFLRRRDAGGYALWWEAHGLCYGIATETLEPLATGGIVVASVSRAIVAEAATRFAVRVIEITAPAAVLAQRLSGRARESAADIALRLQRSVALPPGIPVTTVMNDATVEEGAARLLAAITPAAADAPKG